MKRTITFFCFLFIANLTVLAKDYTVLSPDKKNIIKVTIDQKISWSVLRDNEVLIKPSLISLTLSDGKEIGKSFGVYDAQTRNVNNIITAVIPVRNKFIPEVYNELKLKFKEGYAVEFRAYDEGVAYRFVSSLGEDTVIVSDEKVSFNFNDNCTVYLPKENNPELQGHYEASFVPKKLQDIPSTEYGYLPLYLSTKSGIKMVVSESDLHDYPNLFLYGTGGNSLTGAFPKVVLETKNTGNIHLDETIVRKADYIASTKGTRTFPWRVIMISSTDKALLQNELIYKLAEKCTLTDTKWIKPGKVSWDWWNANNIYGVDFKSGINAKTYKYYIDFASAYGLDYIALDEGWSKSPSNIIEANPSLDLQEVIRYAKAKKIGVILWTLWKPLNENMDVVLDQYSKWGISGVKVDFMARADQYMVNFYERLAAAAAKRKLFLDFHGAFKPVGPNRKYPNVLNYEGVKGLEQCKWDTTITPVHNTILPFTRMAAGPMDFTPGAMVNTNKDEFYINFTSPASRGTRAQQASMYVIYDAPLQMLADSPSNYYKEPRYTRYISRIPTVWDETIALEGKIGEYVLVARRNGKNWYIGGMTDWNARSFQIPLNFLKGKKYSAEILTDGKNVANHAADYQLITKEVKPNEVLSVDMAAGGGYVAILTPIK